MSRNIQHPEKLYIILNIDRDRRNWLKESLKIGNVKKKKKKPQARVEHISLGTQTSLQLYNNNPVFKRLKKQKNFSKHKLTQAGEKLIRFLI